MHFIRVEPISEVSVKKLNLRFRLDQCSAETMKLLGWCKNVQVPYTAAPKWTTETSIEPSALSAVKSGESFKPLFSTVFAAFIM
jgi:hypothetical protein